MSSSGNRVTLTSIARELGVSAMTVSNAYNHPDRLSEALRERIFETAAYRDREASARRNIERALRRLGG